MRLAERRGRDSADRNAVHQPVKQLEQQHGLADTGLADDDVIAVGRAIQHTLDNLAADRVEVDVATQIFRQRPVAYQVRRVDRDLEVG